MVAAAVAHDGEGRVFRLRAVRLLATEELNLQPHGVIAHDSLQIYQTTVKTAFVLTGRVLCPPVLQRHCRVPIPAEAQSQDQKILRSPPW